MISTNDIGLFAFQQVSRGKRGEVARQTPTDVAVTKYPELARLVSRQFTKIYHAQLGLGCEEIKSVTETHRTRNPMLQRLICNREHFFALH